MDTLVLKKKALVYNFIEFLNGEVKSPSVSEDHRDSIEVALQCLESAYEITSDDKKILPKVELLRSIELGNQTASEEQIQLAEQHKNLGNNAMKNGLYEEAVTQYTKAIEWNPKNAVYFCNRAAAFTRLDNNEDAIKDCKQALVLDPSYGKAYGRLGIAYSNLNMWTEAVQAYESSLKCEPDNVSYKTNLNLAKEKLIETMESAAPPQHRPIDIAQFINNESFVSMAREMMANPEFQNFMSGIMTMSNQGDTNFEALFQAGQNLANQMQHQDPNFVQNLRRQFDDHNNSTGNNGQSDPSNQGNDGNEGGDAQ